MPITTITEAVPAEILEDLRDGLAHVNRLLEQAQQLQKQADHAFGMAEGAKAEVDRLATRRLRGGKQDILNIQEGTITRVVEVADPAPPPNENPAQVASPEKTATTENPDGA